MNSSTAINSSLNKLLTPQQTAEILGVSTGTLDVWRCTGRYSLPYVRVGKLIRYNVHDINAFIARRTLGHTGECYE
ncbi:MAG: helix-turn-helix domain-containing protein [Gammaproteobacteria bacterium]|nr:helix-turn-helix domain-containing protein [Gammaproteobacteria bacterium]